MTTQKTKSIHNIEQRMEELDPTSFRYKVLDSARSFKSSWIELGQYLYTIYTDKLFKGWGYLTFEAYCAKEIGIKQVTAVKLLKSYSFLEHEEPTFLKKSSSEETSPAKIPSYESVNALRLVKASERLSDSDYQTIREEVLDDGKEEAEVKKKIKYILKANPKPLSPEDKEDRRVSVLRKVLAGLRTAKRDLQELSFPSKVLNQLDELVELLSEYEQ